MHEEKSSGYEKKNVCAHLMNFLWQTMIGFFATSAKAALDGGVVFHRR
ncbi:hypothetical protein [Paraburkholderia diazotrophica]